MIHHSRPLKVLKGIVTGGRARLGLLMGSDPHGFCYVLVRKRRTLTSLQVSPVALRHCENDVVPNYDLRHYTTIEYRHKKAKSHAIKVEVRGRSHADTDALTWRSACSSVTLSVCRAAMAAACCTRAPSNEKT